MLRALSHLDSPVQTVSRPVEVPPGRRGFRLFGVVLELLPLVLGEDLPEVVHQTSHDRGRARACFMSHHETLQALPKGPGGDRWMGRSPASSPQAWAAAWRPARRPKNE